MTKRLLGLLLATSLLVSPQAQAAKFSDIPNGGAFGPGADKVVTLRNGNTDLLTTLAPSAGTDTTNASNISSGTLPAGRLPLPTASTLGGVQSYTGVSHQWINAIGTSGIPTSSQPTAGDILGLAASATTDATNAANISAGTLPSARLPLPTATTLGGVQSLVGVSHQWISSIGTSGVPVASQPAFSDISGILGAAQLPTPTASSLGGVQSIVAVSHNFLTGISTSGVPSLAQPAAGDITGLAPSATTDTTSATNITSGTLPAARLPAPTATTPGGIQSLATTAHQWLNSISTAGVPVASQPAFTDISGTATASQGGTGATSLGAAFTNSGSVLNATQPINSQTGTSYAIASTDAAAIVTFTNSSPVAATLAQATTAGFNAGFSFYAQNLGAGVVTITPATSTINGAATLKLAQNEGCQITSDGTNYQVSACTGVGAVRARSGTYATKPAPLVGLEYFATDLGNHGCLLVSDGSVWKPSGGSCTIYQSGAQTTLHTGDLVEANVLSIPIPAGLLSSQGSLHLIAQPVKTGTNATATWGVYFSATSGGTAGTQFYQVVSSAATKLSESLNRSIWNRNATNSQVSQALTNAGIGESTNSSVTMAIDTTAATYLNFTGKAGNAGDAVGFDAVTVIWND